MTEETKNDDVDVVLEQDDSAPEVVVEPEKIASNDEETPEKGIAELKRKLEHVGKLKNGSANKKQWPAKPNRRFRILIYP